MKTTLHPTTMRPLKESSRRMPKPGRKSLLMIWILLASMFSLNSQVYIINDSFEDETLGAFPSGWIMKYNGTGDANQKVVDTPVKNGIQAFQMEGQSGWASEFYKVPAAMPDKVTLEAWVNVEKTLSGLAGSIGLGNFTVGTWGTRTSRLQFYAGKIVATYSSNTTGPEYVIGDYVPGTWYHIKMEHDLTARIYKVYIDGVQVSGTDGASTISDFPMHPSVESIHVMLTAGNSGTTKMFFDDIRLYQTRKPVAWYPFDGDANDISGNNNHGTVNGPILTTDRLGNDNSAYQFDGSNDYIECLQPGPLGTSARTITFWAKTTAVPTSSYDNAVMSYGISTSSFDYGRRLEVLLNSRAYGLGMDVGGAHLTRSFDNSDQDWHFYALVFEGGDNKKVQDFQFYADGQLLTTDGFLTDHNHTINTSDQYPINIGRLYNNSRFFEGALDEVIIYEEALTPEEITSFYHANGWDLDIAEAQLMVEPYSVNALKATWQPVTGATSYQLEVAELAEGPFSTIYSGVETQHIHQGLSQGDTRYYRIKAFSAIDESDYSDIKQATTSINARLLAHYPFNGNANDVSGNNYHGTVTGAVLTPDKNGNEQSAYLFDGNDFIDVGDWENGGEMTISAWARQDAIVTYSRIICFGNGASSDNIIMASNSSTDNLYFSVYNGSSSRIYNATDYFLIGSWHHYVVTIDANGIQRAYRDGIQIGTDGTAGFVPNIMVRTSQFIGKSNWNDGYFKGAMDDIRIYGRAMSSEEVSLLYGNDVTTGIPNETMGKISLSPNPVKDLLLINNLPEETSSTIEISNLNGQVIRTKTALRTFATLEFSDLPNGLYLVKIQSASGTQVHKILKN